jgi:hypothetical protein
MSDQVSREKCEEIVRCLPANSDERCTLRDLARAHIALLDASEETIRADERERCARVADVEVLAWSRSDHNESCVSACRSIAAAIRRGR